MTAGAGPHPVRRRALLCLTVPAAAAFRRPALAWREQAASPAVAQDWAQRCGRFAAAAGPVTICPFCGCPVAGARDHGEAGPLPPS